MKFSGPVIAPKIAFRLAIERAAMLAGTIFILAGCGPDPYEFDEAKVEQIISVLAADDMRGRSAFSPDAMRAADFITEQFAEIGLETFAGDTDFLQEFSVYSVISSGATATVNGEDLSPDRVVASLTSESIDWNQDSDVQVTRVGPDDNPTQAFQSQRTAGGNVLLAFHETHAETFDRLRGFASRPSRTTNPAAGTNLVMMLVDDLSIAEFTVQATATIETMPLANVVGMIPGNRPDEYVLFTGHYDHIGVRNVAEGDSIANGANDNASGTTAVIELARYFQTRPTPERSIIFVAFTAEESGGYGSRHFSEQLDPEEIVAMFNIEMIGKPAVEGPNTAWITGFERSSFGEILQDAVQGTEFEFYPDPYPTQNLFYRSDNATLARLGVPAHTISTTPIDVDEDYHQVSDEVSTLNLSHLTNTIRAIAAGARTIISGEATPTRVDPASV